MEAMEAMEYPLSPVPLSIAAAEGGRRTTSNIKLLDIINATVTVPPNSPKSVISLDTTKPFTLIFDLIPAIRGMTKIPEIYKQLAKKFLAALRRGYYRIDLVADTYRDILIKRCKCLDRGTSTRIMISSSASRIPSDFSKYMKCDGNKIRLIDLIGKVISADYKKSLKMLKWKETYFSKEDNCFLFKVARVVDLKLVFTD